MSTVTLVTDNNRFAEILGRECCSCSARQITTHQNQVNFNVTSAAPSGTYCGKSFLSNSSNANFFTGINCDEIHDFSEIDDEDLIGIRDGKLYFGVSTDADAFPAELELSVGLTKQVTKQ